MPNGRPGDHPLTDLLAHGAHPFPADIETMLRQVLEIDPMFPDGKRPYLEQCNWDQAFFDWEKGKNLEEGRAALTSLLKVLRTNEIS
jgi:hypothetical protein